MLFCLVLEALWHKFCTGVPWKLLYADDLVLIAETQEERNVSKSSRHGRRERVKASLGPSTADQWRVSARLCSMVRLAIFHHNDRTMIRWIWGTKDRIETSSFSLFRKHCGLFVSRLAKLFNITQIRHGGGLRSRSASCLCWISWVHQSNAARKTQIHNNFYRRRTLSSHFRLSPFWTYTPPSILTYFFHQRQVVSSCILSYPFLWQPYGPCG